MENLTEKQQEAYIHFLEHYPKAVDRYIYGGMAKDHVISQSIVSILIKKGYLVNAKPKLNAYERSLFLAIPQDEDLINLPLEVGLAFDNGFRLTEVLRVNEKIVVAKITYPSGHQYNAHWPIKHTLWGIPEDLKPKLRSNEQESMF
ncbi:hypothetical protein [Emticicia sp. BO119]|uniref:hypothetical protein n=1 Tax=Emticicia sp. BO119 TaxID=2757768 RepID=UPI0015F10FB2|nr:hypothetical protein [Emticicia sp. BO119]MBA4849470.1 hypothetical protein [Emticicia sp. BO119]